MKVLPLHYSGLVVINQSFPQAVKCTLYKMCWRLGHSPAPAGPCPAQHWWFCLLLSFKPSEPLGSPAGGETGTGMSCAPWGDVYSPSGRILGNRSIFVRTWTWASYPKSNVLQRDIQNYPELLSPLQPQRPCEQLGSFSRTGPHSLGKGFLAGTVHIPWNHGMGWVGRTFKLPQFPAVGRDTFSCSFFPLPLNFPIQRIPEWFGLEWNTAGTPSPAHFPLFLLIFPFKEFQNGLGWKEIKIPRESTRKGLQEHGVQAVRESPALRKWNPQSGLLGVLGKLQLFREWSGTEQKPLQ